MNGEVSSFLHRHQPTEGPMLVLGLSVKLTVKLTERFVGPYKPSTFVIGLSVKLTVKLTVKPTERLVVPLCLAVKLTQAPILV